MAETRFEFDDDAMAEIMRKCDEMFENKLGPAMVAQVKKNTPVDLGKLKASVQQTVDRDSHDLYIEAYGDEERAAENRRYYAAWVDLGHRVFVYGHDTGKIRQPTAFMRQALYRRYAGF